MNVIGHDYDSIQIALSAMRSQASLKSNRPSDVWEDPAAARAKSDEEDLGVRLIVRKLAPIFIFRKHVLCLSNSVVDGRGARHSTA
jgi:hypothetical protein